MASIGGNRTNVEKHFVRHYKVLWYVATVKFRVPHADAEEILQRAAISLLTAGVVVDDPRAWLIGAVCNGARHYWRRAFRRTDVEGTPLVDIADPVSELSGERIETAILIREMLARLPHKKRDVLCLHYLIGMTNTEIARHYGTTPRYAQKLITRALHHARRLFGASRKGVIDETGSLPETLLPR